MECEPEATSHHWCQKITDENWRMEILVASENTICISLIPETLGDPRKDRIYNVPSNYLQT